MMKWGCSKLLRIWCFLLLTVFASCKNSNSKTGIEDIVSPVASTCSVSFQFTGPFTYNLIDSVNHNIEGQGIFGSHNVVHNGSLGLYYVVSVKNVSDQIIEIKCNRDSFIYLDRISLKLDSENKLCVFEEDNISDRIKNGQYILAELSVGQTQLFLYPLLYQPLIQSSYMKGFSRGFINTNIQCYTPIVQNAPISARSRLTQLDNSFNCLNCFSLNGNWIEFKIRSHLLENSLDTFTINWCDNVNFEISKFKSIQDLIELNNQFFGNYKFLGDSVSLINLNKSFQEDITKEEMLKLEQSYKKYEELLSKEDSFLLD